MTSTLSVLNNSEIKYGFCTIKWGLSTIAIVVNTASVKFWIWRANRHVHAWYTEIDMDPAHKSEGKWNSHGHVWRIFDYLLESIYFYFIFKRLFSNVNNNLNTFDCWVPQKNNLSIFQQYSVFHFIGAQISEDCYNSHIIPYWKKNERLTLVQYTSVLNNNSNISVSNNPTIQMNYHGTYELLIKDMIDERY